MAGSLTITTDELRTASKNVTDLNGQLSERLEDIRRKLNSLKNTWESEGADEVMQQFNNLNPKFDQYKRIVDSYADFLMKTAEQYEVTESTVKKNAGTLEFK
ncbi:pore-forming ESAT-6 family protein [Murimonas intestini]|uniref:ESAT-6-like protein n=1 Tax=Murimonas intestini TaxID=1337051 RepID=A0AB73T8T4_9FIRM|nr:pore-forming ESAT-6 family protein [Murimonas intestini]MCR1840074.1 pore-forming ESAT-6 family protein [Murimonas intestini]MCR1866912.1 pore-forming ESAT-6 family protein [Murimonas intestini]MCR1883745.1 pore-forming ESAT-6 family protein [Murimonas intestini]